ncbi:ab hydrolase superfamily protein c4a8.06c [Anaeramoeba flamelloides]|uniref:Ab hydrolase superfamily protein c4a8.06c n=1 Tax=Anaeramoeba flamelloides TaxID=1746091 RepID=A0AAV7YMX8_9EUKA|nr:ab hydrolase superfamily protein c4a8.06c [Anaeramoeba flamelloides]
MFLFLVFLFFFSILGYFFLHDSAIHPKIKLKHYLLLYFFWKYKLSPGKKFDRSKFPKTPTAEAGTEGGVTSVDVKTTYEEHELDCRIYKSEKLEANEKRPTMIYAFGGGYVFGANNSPKDDSTCRELVKRNGIVVISVNYRLSPEYPHPAAIDDFCKAILWAKNGDAEELQNVDTDKLFLGGYSAGANLSLVSTQEMINNDQEDLVKAIVSLFPPLIISPRVESRKKNPMAWTLTQKQLDFFEYCYLGKEPDAKYERADVNPTKAKTMEKYPPTFILTGTKDPLYDESLIFKKKLENDGVNVVFKCFNNGVHGFHRYPFLPYTKNAFEEITDFLKSNDLYAKK